VRRRIQITSLSLILSILWGISSCCGPDPYANYLKLVEVTEPKSLDPIMSTDVTMGTKIALMYDNLVQFGMGTEIEPNIAHRWDISDDGKTYTFFLEDSFRFWNGRSIRAKDVKYSFERLLDPEAGSPQTWILTPIKGARERLKGEVNGVAGIKVLDSLTLRIDLEYPFAPFLGFLAMPAVGIVAREGVEAAGDRFREQPLGSGPWIFEEWKRDHHVLFRRNPDYFHGAPKMEGVMIRTITEALTTSIEFEAGNLDVLLLPSSEYKYFLHSKQWASQILKLDDLAFYYVALNCERAPFNNVRIRQAAALAIDREKIIHRILHDAGTQAVGAIPPGLPGYDPEKAPIPFDPDSARRILIEEGYPDGCEFELWVDQSSAVTQTLEAVQAYLNDVGFKCRLITNDWNMMRDAMRKGKTDAYWGNWWADYADAENFLAPLFHSKNAARRNRYHNPEVDALIEDLQRSMDEDRRTELARRADSILAAEVPYVFMWYPTSYTAVQEWVKGYDIPLVFFAGRHLNVTKEPH